MYVYILSPHIEFDVGSRLSPHIYIAGSIYTYSLLHLECHFFIRKSQSMI